MRIVKIGQKIRRQHFFVYSMLCTQSFTEQKTSLSLYFLTDFNNSHTILMRIVSQFCLVNLCQISTIRLTFWRELSHESEHVFKIKIGLSELEVWIIQFPHQNQLSRVDDSSCFLYDGTSQSTLKATMTYIWPTPGG